MSEPTMRERIDNLVDAWSDILDFAEDSSPDDDDEAAAREEDLFRDEYDLRQATFAAADALEARLRETEAERDALRARVAELEAPIKCSTGCCCTCTDPCHSRRDYGERCLRCGKHRPPRGRIVWDDEYDAIGGGK